MLSYTEENYLKALLKISQDNKTNGVGTNELATILSVKPATANDMLKKLKEKKLVDYKKYGKIFLTALGKKKAIYVLRKHRLWETFLYEKLNFTWDEVHEVAEQLEHIQSEKLIEALDKFLGYPEYDPHGDPIPNINGELKEQTKIKLSDVPIGSTCKMVGVKDTSKTFLQYIAKVGLCVNDEITVVSKQDYDAIMVIEKQGVKLTVSEKFTNNIFVICNR